MDFHPKLVCVINSNKHRFIQQKCSVGRKVFDGFIKRYGIMPGTWCKCLLNNNESSSSEAFPSKQSSIAVVCQIYPDESLTGGNSAAYVTSSVTTNEFDDLKPNAVYVLSEIVPLEEIALEDDLLTNDGVDVDVTISEQFIIKHRSSSNKKFLTLAFIKETLQSLLQSLHLIQNCTVRSEALHRIGIVSVRIRVKEELLNSNGGDGVVFQITEDTKLNIVDVNLKQIVCNANHQFYNFGYDNVYRKLNTLLAVSRTRSSDFTGIRKPPIDAISNGLLVGSAGSGKTLLLNDFITRNSCNCFVLKPQNILRQYPGETEKELRDFFENASIFVNSFKPKDPTIILLEDIELICPKKTNNENSVANSNRVSLQLLKLIDALHSKGSSSIVCLATTATPELLDNAMRRPGRFNYEIAISPPSINARRQLLKAFANEMFCPPSIIEYKSLELIAKQTENFVAADLALIIRLIRQEFLRKSPESSDCIDAIVNSVLNKSAANITHATEVNLIKSEIGFNAIGGMKHLKRTLEMSILKALKRSDRFQTFGLSLPKGILLFGPPGCAKTTIAKCLAYEANMSFIATSAAEVYSPYVGCAEKFIVKLFDSARKHSPCILFLDEIDSLVGHRSLNSKSSSDVQTRILSTLLTEMDGISSNSSSSSSTFSDHSRANENKPKHILVVAATNRPDMIDDALLRPGRFDKLIHVTAPDKESRRSILELHSHRMPFSTDIDLDEIARCTQNFSGADICNLCKETAMQALQRDFNANDIISDDFKIVLAKQSPSLTIQQIDWYRQFENKQKT